MVNYFYIPLTSRIIKTFFVKVFQWYLWSLCTKTFCKLLEYVFMRCPIEYLMETSWRRQDNVVLLSKHLSHVLVNKKSSEVNFFYIPLTSRTIKTFFSKVFQWYLSGLWYKTFCELIQYVFMRFQVSKKFHRRLWNIYKMF
jgi:hypothetical protein